MSAAERDEVMFHLGVTHYVFLDHRLVRAPRTSGCIHTLEIRALLFLTITRVLFSVRVKFFLTIQSHWTWTFGAETRERFRFRDIGAVRTSRVFGS